MVGNGILIICVLAIIGSFKGIVRFISEDPCEGSGNYNDPIQYSDDDEDDDEDAETR
jgi:hypothetical protein